MKDDAIVLIDHKNRRIRLTQERLEHILEHPEMATQMNRLQETVRNPDLIVAADADETVHVYHRLYDQTPVTRKYMLVTVKLWENDAFVLTAFFSSRRKKGKIVWPG
ncbi:MAG: hypothetical protein EXR62_16580 [Chloroflexi bacterium]|nr:hypothetical protein [Chloroflexota bacterium]